MKPAEDSEEEDGGEYVLKERDMVEDDEQTLDQEEAHGDIDHQAELDELEKEGRKRIISQTAITCSKSIIETLEQGVNFEHI